MTFWETIERGEYLIIPLAVLFIASVFIWCFRVSRLRKEKKSYFPLMQRVRDFVVEGDIENAKQICDASSNSGASVIGAGLHRIGQPISDVRDAMKEVALIEKKRMEKGERWLKAIAVISPLLGFCGTLIGIIDRLRDLGEMESVDFSMICAALAPTIVTTVVGIGVGIFALIAETFLDASINSAQNRLDQFGLEFTDLLNEPS